MAGAVSGSFINRISSRIVFRARPIDGRSQYREGQLSVFDVFVDLFTGLSFILILLRFEGDIKNCCMTAGLIVILVGLSLVDLKIYMIPDCFILAGIAWWFLFRIIYVTEKVLSGRVEGAGGFITSLIKSSFKDLISAAFFGFSALIISLVMDYILKKESFGGGDIKLIFMTDLYLGFSKGLYALLISCILGFIALLIIRKQEIPFGPYLSMAVLLTILTGCVIGL